ncbi:unnamed protein product [Adineta ricciae]|uniref:Uncharacterized protein n=1 Tax=Adineta ricciae TaxID=249248 RepID=A0A813MIN2_ADIRI|nr:unnamed protein product [Adineta ricciae]
MLTRCRLVLLISPVLIAIIVYPVSFDGKQVASIDAPIETTFDVFIKNLWKFHPFIVDVKELKKINETCSYYEILDQIPLFPSMNISLPAPYYVEMNVDRKTFCLTSSIWTSFYTMHAYHQCCMHTNTLKPSTTIITDQFTGKSWMIFQNFINKDKI